MTSTTRTARSKTLRLTAIGIAATGLCVAGASFAAASAPASSFGQAVGTTAHAAGIAWSAMPDGYTEAQYEAYWGAGFTSADTAELMELWDLDALEAKSDAGQLVLDGKPLPFEPGTHPEPALPDDDQGDVLLALLEAGYGPEQIDELSALWKTDNLETKARAGEMLLDGETLPVEPGNSQAPSASS